MAKTGTMIDLQPIDRLEEKVKQLVAVVERLRQDQTRAADENGRLTRELDSARTRIAELERSNAEASMLREERDVIRTRVTEMLEQLQGIDL
jgi:regulator of replication initiation timing